MADVSSPAFWQDLYERGCDGWETGAPAPPLVSFVETTPPTPGRVAVIGCGVDTMRATWPGADTRRGIRLLARRLMRSEGAAA